MEEFFGNVRRFGTVLNDAATSLEATTDRAARPRVPPRDRARAAGVQSRGGEPGGFGSHGREADARVESGADHHDGSTRRAPRAGKRGPERGLGQKRAAREARTRARTPSSVLAPARRDAQQHHRAVEVGRMSPGARRDDGGAVARAQGVEGGIQADGRGNEAKDIARHLTTLETSLSRCTSAPGQVIDSLRTHQQRQDDARRREVLRTKERMTKLFQDHEPDGRCENVLEDGANVRAHDKVKLTSS